MFGEDNYIIPQTVAEVASDLRNSFGDIIHITEGDYTNGCSSLAITFQKTNYEEDESKNLYVYLFHILETLNTGDQFWSISIVKMSRIVYLNKRKVN